ncbi:MAG: hypothetical protein HRU15_01810 [Planctomycetes bacterium]|nr:hypothetical protein [Planctomycetota bacterium]
MLATLVLSLATACWAADVYVRAGPWILLHHDQSLRIGMEIATSADNQDFASIHLQRAAKVLELAPNVSEPMRRALHGDSFYVSFDVPPSEAHGILSVHGVQDHPVDLFIPPRSKFDATAMVVFASSLNYPLRGDLDRVEKELGENVQLVVLIGDDNEKRIGMGGWEEEIPIVVINDLSKKQNPLQQAIFGDREQWRHGLNWGVLAMPSAPRDEEILSALNSNNHQWQVFLDPQKRWDLGMSQIAHKHISSLRYLLAVCANKQFPIILAAGSGNSFISEPLAVKTSEFGITAMNLGKITVQQWQRSTELQKHGRQSMRSVLLEQNYVTPSEAEDIDHELSKQKSTLEVYDKTGGVVQWPGGIRYCSISAAGLAFRHITDEVAVPIYDPSICAVYADAEKCRIVMSSEYRGPIELQYFKNDEQNMSSWGEQDVALLYKDIIGDDAERSDIAIQSMSWAPSENIMSQIHPTSYELREFLSACQKSTHGQMLLRRLSTMDKVLVLSWLSEHQDASLYLQRDLILRCLENYSNVENSDFESVVKRQDDFHIMWPLLKKNSTIKIQQKIHLSGLLQSRLSLQLNGKLALDQDPMLQRELMSLIFESPYMSPTPLRPLAHGIRKVGHGLAVGVQSPVQRFFDLYGEQRRD